MSDHRDDDFRIRPGVPKNRGQGFVSKVLKQVGKTSGGKSAMRRPASTGSTGKHAGQRPGSRLGRGHTAARFAGAKLTPLSRRVTIKSLLVNQRQVSPQSLSKHLRYIERDGAGRDGEPGRAYGPQADEADLDAFKERCADDRHHFRFIVSPEEGVDLDDLRTYTRHLMNRMEADLGTRLEWVAVDHWNTDNPHTHLIVRGRDDTGKDLIIAGDYIAHGFRHRAAELATEWLGPRTELEIQQILQREVEQERWTSLDHTLQREAGDDGRVQVRRFNEPKLQRQRLLLIGRLQCLQRLGLADEAQPGTWTTHADAEKTLRALGERGDIIRTMQRAMGGQPRELAVFEPGDDGRTIIGRGPPRGWPTSCATGAIWSSTAWTARRTTSRSTPATNPQTIRPARWWKYVVPPRYGRQIAISLRWPAMGSTEPIITWQLPKVRRRPAVIRTKSLPRTFAGWKPCAGPASWNVLPRGCGRYPTTCPSVAASTMRNAWAA